MAVAKLCPYYIYVTCTTIMVHVHPHKNIHIYTAQGQIRTPLIVSPLLRSLANKVPQVLNSSLVKITRWALESVATRSFLH